MTTGGKQFFARLLLGFAAIFLACTARADDSDLRVLWWQVGDMTDPTSLGEVEVQRVNGGGTTTAADLGVKYARIREVSTGTYLTLDSGSAAPLVMDVPMTWHKRENELRCHYCGYHMPVPTVCPTCGGELKAIGFGTERIEDEIQTLFPEARVLRMDLDTTRNRSAYQDIINAFANHECDILVGTQMVTKGLHFDDVRLVAVLNADPLFNQPDFRAYERAYQMLEQVAGRAGRKGTKGEVIIQSFEPRNVVLGMVQNHDYEALYNHQIAERKLFNYPPFYRVIRLQLRDHNGVRVHQAVTQLQGYLVKIFGPRVSGVIIPAVEKIQAYTIRELTLRIEQGANMSEAKRRLKEVIDQVWSIPSVKNVKIVIDVDPQ